MCGGGAGVVGWNKERVLVKNAVAVVRRTEWQKAVQRWYVRYEVLENVTSRYASRAGVSAEEGQVYPPSSSPPATRMKV